MIYANISKNFLGEFHLLYKIYCTKELSTKLSRRLFGVDSLFEYSINDTNNDIAHLTSEGLLRQILKTEKLPPVIMLAMMGSNGQNAQSKHLQVAKYYDIPFVSFRNVCEPMLKDGTLKAEDVLADDVHPNDAGHALAAKIVKLVLNKARKLEEEGAVSSVLPEPRRSDKYEFITFLEANEIKFKSNDGWAYIDHEKVNNKPWSIRGKRVPEKTWRATTLGSKIKFDYEGTFFALTYFQNQKGNKMGIIKVTIDGKEEGRYDGEGTNTWGWMLGLKLVGEFLPYGHHSVEIELIDAKGSFDIFSFAYGFAGKPS